MLRRALPFLLLVLAIAPAATFAWQFRDVPQFGSAQDDAVYLESGKALSEGQGYRLPHLPERPYATKYPPGYPALIAIIWRFAPEFPRNLQWLVVVNLAALAIMLAGAFRLFRLHGLSQEVAALLAVALGWLHPFTFLAVSILTEIVFTALLVWVFVALESIDARKWRFAALGGAIAAAAYLTRASALPLLLSVPLCLAIRRRYLAVIAFALTFAPVIGAWSLWRLHHPLGYHDYVSLFYLDYEGLERQSVGLDNILSVLTVNVDVMLTSIGEVFVFALGQGSWWGRQAARLIGIAAMLGAARFAIRSRKYQYAVYGALYCLMMSVWHYPPGLRFFVPLVPLFVAGLWTECAHVRQLIRQAWSSAKIENRISAAAFAAGLAAFLMCMAYSAAAARFRDFPAVEEEARVRSAELRRAFRQVAALTPARAAILSDQDVLLSLYTGRSSYRTIVSPRLFYPMREDLVRAVFAGLPDGAGRRWDYALVTRWDWLHTLSSADTPSLRKTIDAHPGLDPVWRSDFAVLYARREPGYRALARTPTSTQEASRPDR